MMSQMDEMATMEDVNNCSEASNGGIVDETDNAGIEASAPAQPTFTYDDLFPALPMSPTFPVSSAKNNDNMKVGSSLVTQRLVVPFDQRKQDHSDKFGERESFRTCQNIAKDTSTQIEVSSGKDLNLTFVITGKERVMQEAKRRIIASFQTQASKQISIPKEHHRWILGKQGTKLKDLERNTATKINVPNIDSNSDMIVITGTKEGIEMAEHEIRVCSDEQSRKASERISVPKIYHPFIVGAHSENLANMIAETGARIHIPPASVHNDEIMIAGEKEGVMAAKAKIEAIYKKMEKTCSMVSVEVPKSQHKYVIGKSGSTIQEILKETGVSIEMPPSDSTSVTIHLRGPQDKLGLALSKVYEKANSRCTVTVSAPSWIYKYIIGKKGAKIKKITQDFPKVHFDFPEENDMITIEGPSEEVEKAQSELDGIVKNLQETLTFKEINCDTKYLKHIVGKNRNNINKLRDDHNVTINVGENIRIEGTPPDVAAAEKVLKEMINKLENEREKDVIIDHKYFKSLIGNKGEHIKEIKEKFNNLVQIVIPNPNEKTDIVKLKGPHDKVEQCHKFLIEYIKKLSETFYVEEVPVFKQFHKFVIGKGGSNIKKIRDETQTKIDLPAEGDQNEVITVTGKKENVDEAVKRIKQIYNELANVTTEEVSIPPKFYNSLIGTRGKLIHSIMEECGGVSIKFPSAESKSDRVTIKGPAEEVERAKKQLLELANERQLSSFSCEVKANPQHHRFLIGKNGVNIRKLREQTGARIIFPGEQDADREAITIIGKQEAVEDAKARLEVIIRDIDNIVEGDTEVPSKYHRHFVAKRGEVLGRISDDCGGVQISFPRHGVNSDRVVLKGAKECIAAAITRIGEIVADLEAQVTIECVIPQKYHRNVMGAKGMKVQGISRDHEVQIKFPEREQQGLVNGGINGETEAHDEDAVRPQDIIRISGKIENCNAAKQALLDQVPVTEDVNVPYEVQRSLLGNRGRDVRDIQDRFDVHIALSSPEQKSDILTITGTPCNVEKAKEALEERKLKAFEMKVEVDPEYHPMVIGKSGAVITKIRTTHDVVINLPKKGDPDEGIITIQGYEKDAIAARDEILKIVEDLNNMIKEEIHIDSRVHSRLIGARGRNIKKIMDEHKVDIRFPRRDGDPDIITIIGSKPENIEEAKITLENLQDEYLEDVMEKELMTSYRKGRAGGSATPTDTTANNTKEESPGFVVPAAPWDRAPDTSSTTDFPTFGPPPGTQAPVTAWGPRRQP